MKRKILLLVPLLFLLASCQGEMSRNRGVTETDPALSSIKRAEDLYRRGLYQDALRELRDAMSQIKARQTRAIVEVLPPPPRGWRASDPNTSPLAPDILGGGVKVSRHYTGPGGEEVDVSILSQSPLIQSILSLISSVSLTGQIGNTRLFYYRGEKALERFYPQEKRGELDVVVDGKTLVMVKGQNIPRASVLNQFLDGIDWEKMRDIIG